ncbi:Alpha-amylase [Dactylellina cionopaga]|nr:Alpha-amylase [Dactylellina cionopaga]
MLDVVVNHMGKGPVSTLHPFANESFYHPYCLINDYTNQDEVEKCRFAGELPDINTEDPQVRNIFNSWISDMINTYRFDGLRIDTARHVEKSFYKGFLEAAGNPYAIGEVFHADTKYVAGYQEVMPAVFNYPLYWALIDCYVKSNHFEELVNTYDNISRDFKDPHLLGTFVDNHDVPRFMSQTSDTMRLKNALAYVILARGIPIVYYGTEYGYMGTGDPGNREDLWRMGYETSGDLWGFIKILNDVRSKAGGLGENDHNHLLVEEGGYVFARGGGKVLVLTSNKGGGDYAKEYCFLVKGMESKKYESVFTGRGYETTPEGRICVVVEGGAPEVLVVYVNVTGNTIKDLMVVRSI